MMIEQRPKTPTAEPGIPQDARQHLPVPPGQEDNTLAELAGENLLVVPTADVAVEIGPAAIPSIDTPIETEHKQTIERFTGLVQRLNNEHNNKEIIAPETWDEYMETRYAIKALLLPDPQKSKDAQRAFAGQLYDEIQDDFTAKGLTEQFDGLGWTMAVDTFEAKVQPELIEAAKRHLIETYGLHFVANGEQTQQLRELLEHNHTKLQFLGIDKELTSVVEKWIAYASLPMIMSTLDPEKRRSIKHDEKETLLAPFTPRKGTTELQTVLERDALRGNPQSAFPGELEILMKRINHLLSLQKASSPSHSPLTAMLTLRIQELMPQLREGTGDVREALAIQDAIDTEFSQREFRRGSLEDKRAAIVLAARQGEWQHGQAGSLDIYPPEFHAVLQEFDTTHDHNMDVFLQQKFQTLRDIRDTANEFFTYYQAYFVKMTLEEYKLRLKTELHTYGEQKDHLQDGEKVADIETKMEKIRKTLDEQDFLIDYYHNRDSKNNSTLTEEAVAQTYSAPVKKYDIMTNEQRQEIVVEMISLGQQTTLHLLRKAAQQQAA